MAKNKKLSKVVFKAGAKKEERKIPSDLIKRVMEKVLSEHPHLCGTCGSNSCGTKRNINNEIVVRGVETRDRNYIFECLGCRRKSTEEKSNSRGYTQSELEKKYGDIISVPCPSSFNDRSSLVDDYIENYLVAAEELESEYGDLLPDEPVVFFKQHK